MAALPQGDSARRRAVPGGQAFQGGGYGNDMMFLPQGKPSGSMGALPPGNAGGGPTFPGGGYGNDMRFLSQDNPGGGPTFPGGGYGNDIANPPPGRRSGRGYGAGGGDQVRLYQKGPGGMPQRLTNAAANQYQAEAYRSSDPRAMAQSFGRKGFSRGAGQYSLGAATGAKNYTANMAQSQATRMNDAFGNATQQLGETSRNEQFGTALAGLSEDARNDSMDSFRSRYNMLNGLFGGFGGSRAE